MNGLDRDQLAERDDCWEMAALLISIGQAGMAAPWLMRAARIHCSLRMRRVI